MLKALFCQRFPYSTAACDWHFYFVRASIKIQPAVQSSKNKGFEVELKFSPNPFITFDRTETGKLSDFLGCTANFSEIGKCVLPRVDLHLHILDTRM